MTPAYYQKNRERLDARNKAWAVANRERSREIKQTWKANNPEKVKADGQSERAKKQKRRWRQAHEAELKAYFKNHYANNRETILKKNKVWRELNPGKNRQMGRIWRQNNPDKMRQMIKRSNARREVIPSLKIRARISRRIWEALKRCLIGKSAQTIELLACDIDWLMAWLEVHFQPGMTWENYGRGGWHIDHKRPCSSFDLTDPAQQKLCFHWTNLQPLWEKENLSKHAKWAA